jgi:chromosome segregation ATPase
MPVVDTLRLKTKLSDSGMPETQAQVLVEELDEALSTAIAAQVATKADVVELRAAISAIYERFEQVDKRFEQVDKRFEQVDKRFEQVDKRFEQVDKRFDDMNQRFNELNQSVIQMRSWLVGLYFFIAFGFLGMIMKDMIFR